MTLMDYSEAARFLKIAEQTLRRKCMTGQIPHLKPFGLRGRTLFVKEDLERFLLSSRKGGAEAVTVS